MSLKVKVSIAIWLLVGAGWYLWQRGDAAPLETIALADGFVTVRNQTGQEWQSVRIWVNEHYAGTATVIPAGGFVREHLSRFVAAGGQRIDVARTRIFSVVVLARTPEGVAVRIVWGTAALH